ncbi:MAG: hypothetical protein IJP86_05520 [Synergistaceae bacterium]|nr:hypothetical protein [Synergistaceae bacterium]
MMTDIIAELKALPFTLNAERDDGGICVHVNEFPDAYDYGDTYDETLGILARSLKDCGRVIGDNVDSWRKGREKQLPYLLKILVSTEEELLECLRKATCVNI